MNNQIALEPQKQELLKSIVEDLQKIDGVVAIVLGGSYAEGLATPSSDMDIGIYYSENNRREPIWWLLLKVVFPFPINRVINGFGNLVDISVNKINLSIFRCNPSSTVNPRTPPIKIGYSWLFN